MITRPKVIGRGDLHAARQLIGEAQSQLAILKRQRALGLKDEYRQVKPYEGVIFECISDKYGDEIIITVLPPKRGGEQVVKKPYQERECFCFPHFAYGVILEVTPKEPTDAFLLDGRFKYNVEICAKDIFLLFEGVYDANFGRYYKDQHVLVSMGDEMDAWDIPLDCKRPCLTVAPQFEVLIVSPVHINEAMAKWKFEREWKS